MGRHGCKYDWGGYSDGDRAALRELYDRGAMLIALKLDPRGHPKRPFVNAWGIWANRPSWDDLVRDSLDKGWPVGIQPASVGVWVGDCDEPVADVDWGEPSLLDGCVLVPSRDASSGRAHVLFGSPPMGEKACGGRFTDANGVAVGEVRWGGREVDSDGRPCHQQQVVLWSGAPVLWVRALDSDLPVAPLQAVASAARDRAAGKWDDDGEVVSDDVATWTTGNWHAVLAKHFKEKGVDDLPFRVPDESGVRSPCPLCLEEGGKAGGTRLLISKNRHPDIPRKSYMMCWACGPDDSGEPYRSWQKRLLRVVAPQLVGPPVDPDAPVSAPGMFGGVTLAERNEYFRPLGMDADSLYYVDRTGHVKGVSADGGLNARSALRFAPLRFWRAAFDDGDGGVNFGAVHEAMLDESAPKRYSSLGAVGSGFTLGADGRPAYHFGNHVLGADGVKRTLTAAEPPAVPGGYYVRGRDLPDLSDVKPLSDAEGDALLAMLGGFRWTDPLQMGMAIGGWAAMGFVASALKQRPHAHVTGRPGCGKSTFRNMVLKPLMGPYAYNAGGKTTEAGVRQAMRPDSIMVVIDDPDEDKAAGLVRMARHSFSGEVTTMGQANQSAPLEYRATWPMYFASVNSEVDDSQDRQRFVTFHLLHPNGFADEDVHWAGLEAQMDEVLPDDVSVRLARRMWDHLRSGRVEECMTAFAAASRAKTRRQRDIVAYLATGAWLLAYSDVPTAERAVAFLDICDFSAVMERQRGEQDMAVLVARSILDHRPKRPPASAHGGARHITVGQGVAWLRDPSGIPAVDRVVGGEVESFKAVTSDDLTLWLGSMGMKYTTTGLWIRKDNAYVDKEIMPSHEFRGMWQEYLSENPNVSLKQSRLPGRPMAYHIPAAWLAEVAG